ncbi:MAG: hypothetical protein IIA05_09170 [Proteobacteria bacterium]|nr:hypothetical protein [Pseudomonadota bacterium]
MEETKFKSGKGKTGGRVKGTPNKSTVKIKQAILNAFEEVDGEKYLVGVAKSDPRTFCTLLGKVMPAAMKHEIEIKEPPLTSEQLIARLKELDEELANVLH